MTEEDPRISHVLLEDAGAEDHDLSRRNLEDASHSRRNLEDASLMHLNLEDASLSFSEGPQRVLSSSEEPMSSLVDCVSVGSPSEGTLKDVGEGSGEDCEEFECDFLGSSDTSLTNESELISDEELSESECETAELKKYDSGAPLYPNSAITDDNFSTVFLSLAQRHNLTYASQSDLLKMLSLLLPSPSTISSSSHMLLSKYVSLKVDTIVQHYCGSCSTPIESGYSCGQPQCTRAQLPRGIFIRIPLTMQLKERFEGKMRLYTR